MIIMDPSETSSSDERSPLKGSSPTSPTTPAPLPPPPYGAVQYGPAPPTIPLPQQYYQPMSHQGPVPQGYIPPPPPHAHHYHHQPPHQVHYQHLHGHEHGHGHGPHFHHHSPPPPHSPHRHLHSPPPPPHHHESHYYPHHDRRRGRSSFIRFFKAWGVAMLVLILWAFLMDSLQVSVNRSLNTGRSRSKSGTSAGEASTPIYRCPCEPVEVEVPLPEVPEGPGRVLPIRYPPVLSQASLPPPTLSEEEEAEEGEGEDAPES